MIRHLVLSGTIWGSVGLLGILTLLAGRQKPKRAATLFATAMFCGTWWAGTSALGLFASSDATMVFWDAVGWAGIVFIPVTWMLFALEYTGRSRYVTIESVVGLSILPTTTIALVMTNSLHGAVYRSLATIQVGPVTVLDPQFGPWFWVHVVYSYVLLLTGVILFVQLAIDSQKFYRSQVVALMAVLVPPFVANLLYLFSPGPFNWVDPTPYSFVLSGLAGLVALKRYRFLDAVPVTNRVVRRSLVDEMEEGVVVVDANDQIVRMNPQARSLFVNGRSPIGDDAGDVISEYDRISSDEPNERPTIAVQRSNRERIYEVRVTELDADSDRGTGTILVFYDVTTQRMRLQRLDVLNRVLRHNLRNEMNVVYGYADQISNPDESKNNERIAQRIQEKSLSMVDLGNQARKIDEILEMRDDDDDTAPLPQVLQWVRERIARNHPEVTVDCRQPDSKLECTTALETVLKILVEEVIEHNDATETALSIEARVRGTEATITVSDNGSGIPASERLVVESGEETKLRHGSGLGLWLANWGTQAVGGMLSIPEQEDGGIVAEITVPVTNEAEGLSGQ